MASPPSPGYSSLHQEAAWPREAWGHWGRCQGEWQESCLGLAERAELPSLLHIAWDGHGEAACSRGATLRTLSSRRPKVGSEPWASSLPQRQL